jgi:tetratricopeptide (TPR) repeat protein
MKHSLLLVSFCWLMHFVAAGATAQSVASDKCSLWLPGETWRLELTLPGYRVTQKEYNDDGTAVRLQAESGTSDATISAFVEKAPHPGDARQCRSYYLNRLKQNSKRNMQHMRELIFHDVPVVMYDVPDYQWQNWNVYLAEKSCWIDVHMSQSRISGRPEDYLPNLLNSIHIHRDYHPSPELLATVGSLFHLRQKWEQSIPLLEAALAGDATSHTLSQTARRVATDNLAMGYGISGQLDKCEVILQQAIQQDPQYPNYHYSLACAYGERAQSEKALAELRLSWNYRANRIAGEKLPDPRTDSSFARLMHDSAFSSQLAAFWGRN